MTIYGAEEDQNLNMNRIAQYGLLGFVQALQLILRLYRVDGARVGLCCKFGAPVPSAVPSAGTRQVRNSMQH